MRILAAIIGCLLLATVIVDSFQTVMLARRANRRFRISRAFYLSSWAVYSAVARRIDRERRRETDLGVFGALSPPIAGELLLRQGANPDKLERRLAVHFMMPLPHWVPVGTVHHNWQINLPKRPHLTGH